MRARKEAVAAAKQLEVDGRAFYLESARGASSKALKAMFTSLANDERNHLAWLDAMEPGVASAASANKVLFGKLAQVFTGAAVKNAPSDIAAIEIAIGMEDKSLAAYAEWTESGESDEVRRLGAVLAGQERFHRQLLENAIEYLSAPGDWFMKEERWNFEGG
jgi:rubrerythrin